MRQSSVIGFAPLAFIFTTFVCGVILLGGSAEAQKPSAGPGTSAGVKLVGSVDPHHLPSPPSSLQHSSKRFLHAGGDSELSREKARAAELGAGAGIVGSVPSELTSAPTTAVSFEGINSNQTLCGCLPPDGDIAEGNGYLVGVVNTAFEVWNKNGQSLMSPSDFLLFFYGCNDFFTYVGISDPFVQYDATANRFVMGALTFSASLNSSRLCLAISQTSDPTGNWYVYYLDVTRSGSGGELLDFPHLSIGSEAFYVSGNQYVNGATVFVGPRVYAFRKSLLYAGMSDPSGGVYHDIAETNQETAIPVRAVGTPGTMYFVAADTVCPCSKASLWEWQDPFGADNFTFNGSVNMLSFDTPPNAQQPGGTIVTNDARILGAYWSNASGVPRIYGVHAIACNPGTGTVACVHWFELANISGTPSLAEQGTIAGNAEDRYFPNIAVDTAGNAVVGFAYSSSTTFAGIRAFDIGSNSELNLKSGNASVNGSRYGDYAGIAVDSSDGCTIWYFEEYANGSYLWDTWGSSLAHADCGSGATPTPTATATQSATSTPTPSMTSTPTPTPTSGSLPTATPSPTAFCPHGQHRKGTC